MLDRIISFSLANRITVLVLTAIILGWGCVTLLNTDVDIFPDLNAPTVVIMTEAPGLAPEEIEATVTYPIETAVNGATDVRRVRSSSATGFSVVWVEFDWGADIYKARQTVSEKIAAVSGELPPGAGVPTLGPQSSILGEVLIIGLSADSTSLMELRSIADRQLRPRLLAAGGVSQVSVIGGDVAEYQIVLSPERMRMHDVTLEQVRESVNGLNENRSGGIVNGYGNEYIVKADLRTDRVDDFKKTVIRNDGENIVRLEDVAEVYIGAQSPRLGAASVKGNPAVLLTVTKQPSTGTIPLTEELDSLLAQSLSSLPADVKVDTDIFRQSDFIGNSVDNLQTSLFEGALFVVVVLFFFLMNLRTTLISLVALPLSIIITVIILHLLGMTINTMSLGGIAIAIGSLVDDAIVDVENVYKRLRANRERSKKERIPVIKVIFEASREVRLPILNSSLIIIASFLPLFFLSGIEGRMLQPLGVSFIVALAASTVVALTVTPVLCRYLLGSDKAGRSLDRQPSTVRWLTGVYISALTRCLHNRKTVLTATGALLIIAAGLFFTLGRSFLPPFNEGSLTINVSALPGISLEESDRLGRIAEEIILSVPEIKTTARKTGRAELDEHSLGVNVSEIEAPYKLDNGRTRNEMVRELRSQLSELPGVNIEIGQPISHRIDAMLSGTEAQIAIKIFGDDLQKLYASGQRVKEVLGNVDGIVDVNIEQQTGRPQIDIRPRRDMLASYGITNSEFSQYVATMLGGEKVSEVYTDNLPYDVTLRGNRPENSPVEEIGAMLIDSRAGKIPLSYVADIESTSGPNTINRENVSRRIVISANVDGRDLRGAVNDIRREIEKEVTLPDGYFITYGGQFENEARASRTLALASIGALVLIIMLLYQEYKNIRQPLIILLNMPLAMIGGVFILCLTSGELNIPAIIGFISLLGITTRNGMLLISRYNSLEALGEGLIDRIMHGSADRLTPIIMTALTSALALIPLALRSSEPGNEIQSPLATVILGGLITSTVLNVFVVPVVYYISKKQKETIE